MRSHEKTVLVVIDMLNACDFEDADKLAASVAETIPGIRTLLDRVRDEEAELIYVSGDQRFRFLRAERFLAARAALLPRLRSLRTPYSELTVTPSGLVAS